MKTKVSIIRVLCLILILAVVSPLLMGCGESLNENGTYVLITFKDYGSILLSLSPEDAPITVAHFLALVNEKFYDGLPIIRIQDGFVIQGGEDASGTVEPIKGEFYANGVNNRVSHIKGVISMARTSDYNSATSQFFLCLDNSCVRSLDGLYAGFGYTIAGMENVEKLVAACKQYGSGSMGFIADESKMPIIKSARVLTVKEAETYYNHPKKLAKLK